MERESMEFDVLIVGGVALRGWRRRSSFKQLAAAKGQELSVCLIEKAEIGAHILSGAVMDPRALTELIPDWKAQGAPLKTAVTEDKVLMLTETGARAVPHGLVPDALTTTATTSCASKRGEVAGRAGRSAGRGGLSGLCRGRDPVRRSGRGEGRGHRRHGRRC